MNHYIQSIRSTFIILMIVGLGFMQSARAAVDSIGVISVVIGEAEIVRANGQSEAKSGAELFRNDLVKTGKASRVQVLLKDQTAVNLGQNAEIRLDEFVYSGAEPKVSLNVAKGTFRFISGKIADQKPDNVKVKTPLAIIGVRGTEYIGRVGADVSGADAASAASKTDVTLLSGVIVVENDLGQQVISKPGFGVTIEPTGAISEPARVSEKELDSKLQAVSTNEEDVKQEEESSDSEPSTEQSPAPAAEEDESTGTSASSTEEEGAKTEDAPAAESQETSSQESNTQESSSADNTSSSESAAEVAPVESTTESADNESSAPEPASPSVTMNTEEGDSATTTNSTSSTTTASTTNEPVSTSANAAGTSTAEPYTAANGGLPTTTDDPAMSNASMTTTQTASSEPFTASSMGTNTSSEPFTASSTAGSPTTYDSSAILAGSNDDYSFAGGNDAPLQTSVYAPAATSDATGYATTANEPAPFTAAETTTNASQTSTINYLTADTYDYSTAVATDDTFALATQVTADNTLQTTEDTAVASSNQNNSATSVNALPSIYGFTDGTDINNPTVTASDENQAYVGTISATDADNDTLVFSVSATGANDEALFVINNAGELSFMTPPNYESPADSGQDNNYVVSISVTDGQATDTETFTIDINNKPIGVSTDFNSTIAAVDENVIYLLPSWNDFFELAQDGMFSFQNIGLPDGGTCGSFGSMCITNVNFSGSYDSRQKLVDVSVQGSFESTLASSTSGTFSATWSDHSITEFSTGGYSPGTASFVTNSTLASIVGEGGASLDADDVYTISSVTGATFLVTSEFQFNQDSRDASIPYSALGRVGLHEFDQSSLLSGSATTNGFLGQPTITDP